MITATENIDPKSMAGIDPDIFHQFLAFRESVLSGLTYSPSSGNNHSERGIMCMIGGIFSDQRCAICNGRFKDDHKRGLFCPDHPGQYATRFVVRFKDITKRFKDYPSAQRFLTGLRFQFDQKIFDSRDFKKGKPLGFSTLARDWLQIKKETVKHKSYSNLENYISRAIDSWKDTNIKEIGYAEIEDFILAQKIEGTDRPVSAKTRANIKSALHNFWTWLRKRRILALHQMPDFPETPFELGFRKTIDKVTQDLIIEEVHRLTYHINPKIWLGIKWLSTYISIRPGELIRVKEQDIDLEHGYITIPSPKEKKPKTVPILDEDVNIIRSFPRGFPALPFFRHPAGISGCTEGEPFGEKYFYKWWKRACLNLDIEGVDLYGGTRHSSARALRKYRTPEEIKRATMHSTNKAFERYFQIEADGLREIYADTQTHEKMIMPDNGLITKKRGVQKPKILKLKR